MRITSLKHHLLVALPSLQDPFFHLSVVYITEHDATGATGFIINKLTDLMLAECLAKLSLLSAPDRTVYDRPVMLGGPVNADQLFLLVPEANAEATTCALALPSPPESMRSLLRTGDLEETFLFLGYSGWSAGQLEQELIDNHWLVVPAHRELLYTVPFAKRHGVAAALLGVDMVNVSTEAGHA